MQTRIIKAEHLMLALVVHRARRSGTIDSAPFAAMTGYPHLFAFNSCDGRSMARRDAAAIALHRPKPCAYPMLPSVSEELVKRTRTAHGLAEVKHIWGIGLKAMLTEINGKKAVAS